ncbi:MAG: dihydroxy-acid dehydratase [Candidatus Latescibacteria bacterium]|nr:dihydroxy-acid dehydratase [Candidatus Latescibacterota bacterium]
MPQREYRSSIATFTAFENAMTLDIALVEEGDQILIDIPARRIELLVAPGELARRRQRLEALGKDAYQPLKRRRYVSPALQAYAALTTSAAQGAVRDLSQLRRG